MYSAFRRRLRFRCSGPQRRIGVKVSVLSRGWATVQIGVLVLGLCALLWASVPSLAQTGALFSTKATPSNSATTALLSSPSHVVNTEQVRAELQVHAPQGILLAKPG